MMVGLKVYPGKAPVHTAKRYLNCLSSILPEGFTPENPRPSLNLNAGDKAWASAFLGTQGFSKGETLIGVNPGAAWATKRWPPKKFAEVLDLLGQKGRLRFLLLGDAKDLFACEEVASRVKRGGRIIVSAGKTSLGQLMGLIARCRVMLTNDSGPMHLAVGLGVPVVALFGPTVEEFGFFPLGPKDQVVEKQLSCRPCALHGSARCPINTHECMEGISSARVFEAMNKVLRSGKARDRKLRSGYK
jgi:heptosyltransferase-2